MTEATMPPIGCEPRQDFWLWRLFATALSFTLFGAGGLVLSLLVFPAQWLISSSKHDFHQRARLAVHYSFRSLLYFMRSVGLLTLNFPKPDRLGKPGQMIIANHPSLLDIMLLIAHVKNANCIVKHGLSKNIFTWGPLTACGYISNDQSMEMLERAAEVLREGQTLIVFPEGTRTPLGATPHFHRGACTIALRGASCITPVVIRMQPRSLTKGEPWYHIPARRITYSIQVGEDIGLPDWRENQPAPIASRKLHTHLHDYYATALGSKS